jgi:hypothetical protein
MNAHNYNQGKVAQFYRELPDNHPFIADLVMNVARKPVGFGRLFADWQKSRANVFRCPTCDAPMPGPMMAERNGGSGTSPPIPAGELYHNVPTLDEDGAKAINEQTILEFLDQTHGDRPRHLVAINPEGGATISKTFESWDIGGLGKWVATMNGRRHWGIYYHVNTLGADCHDKKAEKADIVEARFTHVDVDDADAMERIKAFDPAPTVTVFSGGGFNCLWSIEPTADKDAVEEINKAIQNALKADKCWNIDRILRLPGTINYPNAVKKTKGRGPAQAYIVDGLTDWAREYGLAAFDHLPRLKPEGPKPRNAKEAQECTLRADYDDIDPQTMEIICNGAEVGDRSDKFFETIMELKTLGYSAMG